jgi:hypothetical protein
MAGCDDLLAGFVGANPMRGERRGEKHGEPDGLFHLLRPPLKRRQAKAFPAYTMIAAGEQAPPLSLACYK